MHFSKKKGYKTCTLEYLTNSLIVVKTKLSIIIFFVKDKDIGKSQVDDVP